MGKKFDVVIGNPPYQEEPRGKATHAMPIYNEFMDAAYEVGTRAVLITPARFLFDAGYTPKAWNQKMLNDRHLSVSQYVSNSDELFPGTGIKGGIAVTYRDETRDGEPIGTFTRSPELTGILYKVNGTHEESLASVITSSRSYAYTDRMHADHPSAVASMAKGEQYKINTKTFELLPFLYTESEPTDAHNYVQVLGLIKNRRFTRWVRREYIKGPESYGKFKVAVSKSNGTGAFGEALATPHVIGPDVAVTQSFITIGKFDELSAAEFCLKYVKSKLARALLGVRKVTQDNPSRTWKHVPFQDFTLSSDIDWSKPVAEIDQQLYAKYGLNEAEIEFIESRIKPMI